ncbi:MAG TPA: hypothetical protein VH540_21795 [Ktedonobacterales bacterium]|jgi:hypothetical protein
MFSRSKTPARAACWLLLGLALLLSISGCGTPPVNQQQAVSTQPPSLLTAKIVTRSSASVRAEANQPATATATCNAGEQVIAGSFSAEIFEADSVGASYPSSDHAWTVVASSPASFIVLSVQAYCVPADFPLGIKMVQGTGKIACPSGSVLVNGGFQGGAATSKPAGNGWMSDRTSYALCATRHLVAGASVSAQENLPAGYGVGGSGGAACAQGQVATGGGFSGSQQYPMTYLGPGKDYGGWVISGYSNGSIPQVAPLVWAVCNSVS